MGLPLRKLFHRPHHEIRLAALLADRPLCAVDQWRSNPISDMTAPAPREARAFPTEASWSVNAECAELGIVLVRRNLPCPLSARLHPKDGQTIIPDLAWKWDIAPDGKKYTFHLRKGVKFHDGGDFTAEDVRATYERIARPPKGIVIPRTPLFSTVGDIVALDPHKIEFRLTEPRPRALMLGAFASGWNIIVREKA